MKFLGCHDSLLHILVVHTQANAKWDYFRQMENAEGQKQRWHYDCEPPGTPFVGGENNCSSAWHSEANGSTDHSFASKGSTCEDECHFRDIG